VFQSTCCGLYSELRERKKLYKREACCFVQLARYNFRTIKLKEKITMGRVCGAHLRKRNAWSVVVGKAEGKRLLENVCLNEGG
jgi:hypothetical protein